MNSTERLYRINDLIQQRGVVSVTELQRELVISLATLKRDLAFMRERFNAPIVFDRDAGGYRFDKPGIGPRFQLPGLWFSAEEILALMSMHQMLDSLDPGALLGRRLKPLLARLEKALATDAAPAQEVIRRVKIVPSQRRRVVIQWFELVARALMSRRRIRIDYFTRYRNERSTREVSPQRLVHYRNNWYLDAWCHRSDSIRMFALDSIENAVLTDARAKDVSLKQVDQDTKRGYGIYRGKDLQWATLVFSQEAARWVRSEVWHEAQRTRELSDGRFELKVPYSQATEIEMDILRHGENVEVIAPAELRKRVAARLAAARKVYEK
ncbi:MAG TPA: WYL domain-containing protein [Burkholderiaceae bacterium]|nr:WYL domain-containing protein [Burkholderiaceae bacterium]